MAKQFVEVIFCPETGHIYHQSVQWCQAMSVEKAIIESGFLNKFPQLSLDTLKSGVFSQVVELTTLVNPGDRVEIYRPLTIDPKQNRRQRASDSSK